MRVLYDHQIFTWQRFGGISRYFYELMRHSGGLFEYDVSGIFSENEYMKPLGLFWPFPIKPYFKGKGRLLNMINESDTKKKLWNNKYDVVHLTYYDPYILKLNIKKPLIIDVHDMIFEKLPRYFKCPDTTIKNKRNIFFESDKIISVSQNTKKDLLSIYPDIPEEKIAVIYRGQILPRAESAENRNSDYILFVGQRGGYKNFNSFAKSIAPLLIRYNLRLICTGQAFTGEERKLLEDLTIENRAESKFVSDRELQELYVNARIFAFPSLYEGFGFPILEAFASGCPVALSNSSCFPEIAGDAGMYFDPYNIEDMRNIIEKVILDNELQKTLIENGYKRLSLFSWEKSVKETFHVYSEVINSTPPPPPPPRNRRLTWAGGRRRNGAARLAQGRAA
ncbi:MAG: glycosyltransferase, family 1 [Treponematales bacterium]